ncbi:16030_t:CDS:2 [Cetraspora pellucida]|uniref:16030_t:CDS:1 n=1 Tax=Cetraspora pellucida TaxID=1433469 RepID=A0A9N9B3J9_9GLOM|nr:16030_t:CDS:2 [Cetraspora pellucida]
MIDCIARKQTRIGELLGEKLALQLIYRRCKAEADLSEFNRAWDIPDFLVKLRLYLQNQGVDPADNAGGPPAGREVAIGYLRGCMRGRALEWFDEEITTKQNWELANLLDNTGQANLVAINGRTAVQIGNQALNEALGQPGNTIVKLRAVEGPWDEDWHIAGGRPTNIAVNAPNANNGTTVVVASIRFGQAIWWLKTHFPTVEEELRGLMYGTIGKGNMTIDGLYRKILRIGRRANYRPEELRRKFLDALPLPWLEKAEDIDEHLPLDELAKKLYEIELRRIARHKRDRIPDLLVSQRASREIYEPLPVSAPQQQGISLEDMQKAIQNALAQQKTEYQSLLEKQKNDFQSQMAQQSVAQKAQAPAPQIVEPVRQPRGPPSSLKTEEGMKNYYVAEFLKDLGILNKNDLDADYPVKPFQRPRSERLYSSNQNARIDRIESKIDEIGQMTSQFGRMMLDNQSKKPVAKSNFTRYYPQLPSTRSQYTPPTSDNEEDNNSGYDEENNSQPETYDELIPKLSPAMRKMCLSRKAPEKESDKWFSSLQYLNANINDLAISESFLDPGSEFGGINDPAIKALGWKADKPSDFAIKGNSKHITDSLGWYTDVPVTMKDEEGKTVTVIGNFVRIDNGEPEPMLFLGMSNIRKLQGVPEPNKNQFRIKLHGKTYVIPTFSKAPVAKDPPKEEQEQASTDFSSPTGEKDLKKSA